MSLLLRFLFCTSKYDHFLSERNRLRLQLLCGSLRQIHRTFLGLEHNLSIGVQGIVAGRVLHMVFHDLLNTHLLVADLGIVRLIHLRYDLNFAGQVPEYLLTRLTDR